MSEAELATLCEHFGEQFSAALLIASASLLMCRAIPFMRQHVGPSYCLAALLAALSYLALPGAMTLGGIAAGVALLAVLYYAYRRSLRVSSFDAATIISYEHHSRKRGMM